MAICYREPGLSRAETKGRWLGWKRLPLLRAVEEGRGEEGRCLDETAPLSRSLPAGRGERENAAVHVQHIQAISQFSRQNGLERRILSCARVQKKRKKALDKAPVAANNGWEWEMPAKMPAK